MVFEPGRREALEHGLERYRPVVDDWPGLLDALTRPLPACVWTNPLRTTSDTLRELLEREGLEPHTLAWRPGAFRLGRTEGLGTRWWYLAGLGHAQEEVSLAPVALLDARPGMRVLDLCAAPGGKTAGIAVALGNRGTVLANDVSADRIRALRATLDRLGLVNVTVTRVDGCNYPREAGTFDRVLVDAPCSAEGTLRKRTRVGALGGTLWQDYQGRQTALLRKAVQRCRPGGVVVYSTCTFAPEENEAVVDAVLRESGGEGLRVEPARLPGLRASPGLTGWAGQRFDDSLAGALRIWPHQNDTGGFFVAVLRKAGGNLEAEPVATPPEPVPDESWIDSAGGRFGIPPEVWRPYVMFRRKVSGVHVAARDHAPPPLDVVEGSGLHFMKTSIRYPKLSTPAALLFARHATRNVIELTAGEVPVYMGRGTLHPDRERLARCDGTGYVLLTHRGFGLGVGFHDAAAGHVRSMFPKRWHGGGHLPRVTAPGRS